MKITVGDSAKLKYPTKFKELYHAWTPFSRKGIADQLSNKRNTLKMWLMEKKKHEKSNGK